MGGTLADDEHPGNNFKCYKCKCNNSKNNFNIDQSPSFTDESILTEASSLTPVPKEHEEVTIPANVISKGYAEICSCHGLNCKCTKENFSFCQKYLPRNATFWPKTKLVGLLIAGSLPWIFLLIYVILHYGT